MKDYKAYLFDWDGTLCETLDIWIPMLRNRFANDYNIALTDRELGACLGDWNYIFSLGVPEEDRLAFKNSVELAAYEQYVTSHLYGGVEAMLRELRSRNKKTALITSSRRPAIEKVLARHKLIDLFDLIVTADDVKAHKPDPEGVLATLSSFELGKHQAVMLGDTDKDLGAAKNAGIDSILFYPEAHQQFYDRTHLETFKPVHVLNTWSELATI